MRSLGSVRLFVSALRVRSIHLHGLATAGAMLTCVAATLNMGPFAKAPKTTGLPGNTEPAARTFTEGAVALAWRPQPEIDVSAETDVPQMVVKATDTLPITHWIEPSPIAVVDVAPLEFQPFTPTVGDGETGGRPPRADLATTEPTLQPQPAGDRSNHDPLKRDAIVGVWAPDAGTCSARNFRAGVLPAVINTDGAWAGETFCIFKNKNPIEKGWRVIAECSNPRERWKANVRLTVDGNRLTWSSKRGTQEYTRCAVDVLMAEAR